MVVASPLSSTKLGDEQTILSALATGRANDHEGLVELLGWHPQRLGQTLDRLRSARLVRKAEGQYLLIVPRP